MLILPKEDQVKAHHDARKGLEDHYNSEMETILSANASKERYWILGKVRFPEELGGRIGRTFLQASDGKPPVVKNAFLYEVDNKRGVKTLLWVTHPDGSMRLPTLNKTIQVSPANRAKGAKVQDANRQGRRFTGDLRVKMNEEYEDTQQQPVSEVDDVVGAEEQVADQFLQRSRIP